MELSRKLKHKACDLCKKRKVRCSGRQPCQHCLRANEECVFTSPYGRLANAERRTEAAIERSHLLELAWTKYLPDVPLETALEAVRGQLPVASYDPQAQPAILSQAATKSSTTSPIDIYDDSDRSADEVDFEKDPELAGSLEWDESGDAIHRADGFGSLSMQTQGIGYMGPHSGTALLRNLQTLSGSMLMSDEEHLSFWNTDPQLSDQILTSSAFASRCVDAYFKYFHHAYPIMHEGEFRAQWMGVLPKPRDGSWPILYNVVLAIGAHSGNFSRQNADRYFHQQVCQHLSWDVLQKGSLPLVQALTLLANYLQKRDRPNSGFTILGAAMSMAQGIGLHRELSGPSLSVQAMEIRRRAWWILFIFDSGARITFGRPTLDLKGINVSLPRNLDDADLVADIEELPPPKSYCTCTSSLIWQARLAKIANGANENLLRSGSFNATIMLSISKKMQQWKDKLPAYMKEGSIGPVEDIFEVPRMVLLWRALHLRIIVFRNAILNAIKHREPLNIQDTESLHFQCLAAASECIASIVSFWTFAESRHGLLVWYACYWLVTSVFVYLTCLLYAPQHASALDWRQHIETARTTLEEMSSYELTAARAVRLIDQILKFVPASPDTTFLETNESQRMELVDFWNENLVDLGLFESQPTTRDLLYHQNST